jgi:hypothetical protein
MNPNNDTSPRELSTEELDLVAGGQSIDRTPAGIAERRRLPTAAQLLMADRLGQFIPGQENPIPGFNDDNLPG